MDFKEFNLELIKLIENRKKIHENDPKIYLIWEKLTNLLSTNEGYTLQLLNNSDAHTISLISEVFEDISENLQSVKFIECLENLQIKYPNEPLEYSINLAKEYLKLL